MHHTIVIWNKREERERQRMIIRAEEGRVAAFIIGGVDE